MTTEPNDTPSATAHISSSILDRILPTAWRRSFFRDPVESSPELQEIVEKKAIKNQPHHHASHTQHTSPSNSGDRKNIRSLLHDQTVSAFISAFINPSVPKAPNEPSEVIDAMCMLWDEENSFLSPNILISRLNDLFHTDIPQEIVDRFDDIIEDRMNDREPLTGGFRKQHAPLYTGLAHLHAIATDTPTVLVRGDIIGMGSMNENYQKLLAAAQGIRPEEADLEDAKRRTDETTRAMIGTAMEALQHGARELGIPMTAACFRTGGDEIDIIAKGLSVEETRILIRHYVNPACIDFTAKMGLRDQEHTKDRDDPLRASFGIGFGVMPLDAQTRPGRDLELLERETAEQKVQIGMTIGGSPLFSRHEQPEQCDIRLAAGETPYMLLPGFDLPPNAEAPENRLALSHTYDYALRNGHHSPTHTDSDTSEAGANNNLLAHHIQSECANVHYEVTQRTNRFRRRARRTQQQVNIEELRACAQRAEPENEQIATAQLNDLLNILSLNLADQTVRHNRKIAAHCHELANSEHYKTLTAPQHTPAYTFNNEIRARLPFHEGYQIEEDNTVSLHPFDPETAKRILDARKRILNGEYARFRHSGQKEEPTASPSKSASHLFITPLEREATALQESLQQQEQHASEEQLTHLNALLSGTNPIDPAANTLMGYVMPQIFGDFAQDTETLRKQTGLQNLQSFGLCAGMENLAGVNKLLLTHENANIVLAHVATNIIGKGFNDAGIDPFCIETGHLGGGNFAIATRPATGHKTEQEDARAILLTPEHIRQAAQNITRNMIEFRQLKIADFLRMNGGTTPDDLKETMTFGDVPDPKRPESPGVGITCHFIPLDHKMSGGQLLDTLVKETEEHIAHKRQINARSSTGKEITDETATNSEQEILAADLDFYFPTPAVPKRKTGQTPALA